MDSNNKGKTFYVLGRAMSLAFFMVGATVGGYLVGSYLDSRFGTAPKLMLVFSLMGIAAGFLEFYKVIKNLTAENKKP